MADTPLRGANGRHEWFWEPDDENNICSLETLMDMYEKSVGRNATLIVGLTPDPSGLLPAGDCKRLEEWGQEIDRRWGNPLAQTSGTARQLTLSVKNNPEVTYCILQEDITKGERIRHYEIEAKVDGRWIQVTKGESVGHKRIEKIGPVKASAFRLKVTESVGQPEICNFSIY